MTPKRRELEAKILEEYFPRRYAFVEVGTMNEYLDVGLKTQSGTVYRMNIYLKNFPHAKPEVFLIYPEKLTDRDGRAMSRVSHEMHMLHPKNGNPQICHFKGTSWNPNRTLYQVILKCRLWLEAYEAYMETGKPLNTYLGA